MPDNSSDNIFASLKGLIWGAFIGVVSFQLLAPIIWGYLHAALGLHYSLSYWIFTIVYFLALPAIVFGWLYSNRPLISKYLPNYKGDTTRPAGVFLYGLILFVAAQICITISGFFIHWGNIIFYVVCGVYTFCCGVLLFGCYVFCKQHINNTFCHPNRPREDKETVAMKKATQYFNKLFLPTSLVFGLLFCVAFGFIHHWLEQNEIRQAGSNNYSSYSAGLRSFAFQEMNDTLYGKLSQLQAIEDLVAKDSLKNALDSSSYNRKYSVAGDGITDTIKDLDSILTKYATDLRCWDEELSCLLDKLKKNPDSVDKNAIRELADCASFSLSDSLYSRLKLSRANLSFIKLIKAYVGASSTTITSESKAQLGIQLRSVQTKGMLLLVSLFFTLLALYIFIRIINRIQVLEFDTQQKNQPEATALEDALSSEEEIKESETAASGLWLMITVTAWLLLPIFKPVDDEAINLYEPYKALTIGNSSGAIPSALSGSPGKGINDTIRVFNRFDTVRVQLIDTGGRNLDSASVMKLLHEITDNVHAVKDQLQK